MFVIRCQRNPTMLVTVNKYVVYCVPVFGHIPFLTLYRKMSWVACAALRQRTFKFLHANCAANLAQLHLYE